MPNEPLNTVCDTRWSELEPFIFKALNDPDERRSAENIWKGAFIVFGKEMNLSPEQLDEEDIEELEYSAMRVLESVFGDLHSCTNCGEYSFFDHDMHGEEHIGCPEGQGYWTE